MKRKFIRIIALVAVLAVFAVCTYIAMILWSLRPEEITLSADPLAIREESKALALAREAIREAGYETEDFVADSSSYNIDYPDFRRYNFFATSRLSNHPGLHVQLMQDGIDVQVTIRRRK